LFEWDFDGDGTFEIATGDRPTVEHTFPTVGSHRVAVKISEWSHRPGNSGSQTSYWTVEVGHERTQRYDSYAWDPDPPSQPDENPWPLLPKLPDPPVNPPVNPPVDLPVDPPAGTAGTGGVPVSFPPGGPPRDPQTTALGGYGPVPGGRDPGPGASATPAAPAFTVVAAPEVGLAALRRRGVPVWLSSPSAGRVKLRLLAGGRAVARAEARLRPRSPSRVTLRLSRSAARKVRRGRAMTLVVAPPRNVGPTMRQRIRVTR
jgi:hypothetical protein